MKAYICGKFKEDDKRILQFNFPTMEFFEMSQDKSDCDIHLYVISPLTALTTIAEAVDNSNKQPKKTIFYLVPSERKGDTNIYISMSQIPELAAVGKLIMGNGGMCLYEIKELIHWLHHFHPNNLD